MSGERKFWSGEVVEGRGPGLDWDRAEGGVVWRGLGRAHQEQDGTEQGASRRLLGVGIGEYAK